MKEIREGLALIRIPEQRQIVSSDMPVFYNPRMRVNRDLAVLGLSYVLAVSKGPVMVADPMSASGVRAIRFIKENDFDGKVYANDISEKAVSIIKENFSLNSISENLFEISQEEANRFLRKSRGFGFDYIDLDPFGTPVPFVESCALSLKKGGILSLTATDTAPLSGTYPGTCRRRYGSKPLRNEFKHEVGIRILIKKVIELSAQHDIALEPIFCYSHLHYFKVLFRKKRGVREVDGLLDQMGYILYCFSCGNRITVRDLFRIRENCEVCGGKFSIGGPMWLGKLWEREFTDFIIKVSSERPWLSKETFRILELIKAESELQVPGFYMVSKLCEIFGIPQQPPIKDAVQYFDGVRTHFAGDGLRTALPHSGVLKRAKRLRDIIERRREEDGSRKDA